VTDHVIVVICLVLILGIDLTVVAARSAFIHAVYVRMLALRDEHEEQVNRTLHMLLDLPRVRASFNFVLVFTRFSMAGLILYLLSLNSRMTPLIIIAIMIAAVLLLFWIEWLIEIFTMRAPEQRAMRFSAFVRVLSIVLSPIIALPALISGGSEEKHEQLGTVTEDELRTLVDVSQEEGYVEEVERRMIHSIFQLGDTLVREIMVPRIDMVALDVNNDLGEAVDSFVKSGFSRVPVYEEKVDNTLGLLYAKDLLRIWREGGEFDSLRELLREAYFVPEAKRVDELLADMQNEHVHIAIVVDEYGGVAGLVTLEDIVEEILGEIQDEFDQAEEMPYEELIDGEYLFLGRVDLDDFNEIMGSNLPPDEADTVGGYIYSQLGRVPDVGESVEKDNLLLTVEQVSSRRIRKVRASWKHQDNNHKEIE